MEILEQDTTSNESTTTHSVRFRADSGVEVLVMKSDTTGDWTVVYDPDSRSMGKTFRDEDGILDHYDSITSELKTAADLIRDMQDGQDGAQEDGESRERKTDSEILARGIREEWDEFEMAHGEARIPPTHEAHSEAVKVVPEGTRGVRPVTVYLDGTPYSGHRCRRYPGTVVFSG